METIRERMNDPQQAPEEREYHERLLERFTPG
jgi:hypothetical protein